MGVVGERLPADARLQAPLSSPQATLSSPEMVVVAFGVGVETCNSLHSQPSQNTLHRFQLLQRT